MRIINALSILIVFTFNSLQSATTDNDAGTHHAAVISSTSEKLTIGFNIQDLPAAISTQAALDQPGADREREDSDLYVIPDEGFINEYGKPVLPAISRFVVVPPRAGLELVVIADEPQRIRGANPVAICREDALKPEGFEQLVEWNGIYPPVIAEMSDPIVIRGVRLVEVTIYPLRYDPVSKEYLHYPHIETDIRFTNDEPINPARVPIRRNRSREFLKFINALAINGDEVGRDDPDRDTEPEYVGHYLIVSHERCLEFAVPFIEWRRKAGYKVDILNVPSNIAQSQHERTKDMIEDLYESYLENGIDPFDNILLIGDRIRYSYAGQANWILQTFRGNSTWGGDNHADYQFATLEGNDDFPDAGYSRWHTGNEPLMELSVGRTLGYEAEPFMDDVSWFTRGGNYSQHWGNGPFFAWHPSIPTNARWGEEVLQQLGFDEVYFYEWFDHDRQGNRIGPVIEEWLNEGLNVMLGRAENYYWQGTPAGNGNFDQGVEDNVVFPINIAHSGHAEWCAEVMTRYGSGEHLKGPVAMTWGWGAPQYTAPITACWLEMVNAFMFKDMPLGWARAYAITVIENYFAGGGQIDQYLLCNRTEFDCYGDPGIKPWIGVPRVLDFVFPESITPQARLVEVRVFDPEEDQNVEGAQVTIYAPGNIPDDMDDYAGIDETFKEVKWTDADGIARFVFGEDVEFEPGTMYATVTGRDIRPLFGEIEIAEPETAIELAGYALTQVDGNGDDDVNPGEVFLLELTAQHLGEGDPLEGVTAVVISASPWIEVDENEVSFGDIEAGAEAESDGEIRLHISPACPDGASRPITRPDVIIEFSSGESNWRSAFKLNPVAPNFVVREVVGSDIINYEVGDFDIDVENVGSQDSPPVSAELIPLGMGISVVRETGLYPQIPAGGHSRVAEGNEFLISGNTIVVPGSRTDMMAVFRSEDGFVDTAYFDLQVMEERENAPTGPDGYGYICFDDTDADWDMAPEFDWIEISLAEDDRDFDGIQIDYELDSPYDIGEAFVIELGFTTTFYGYDYTSITVSNNGFIAMGEQPRMVNFQNWPLDHAIGGGVGMIAPLWDDISLRNEHSGVYYYQDEEDSRFIVEWYNVRHRNRGNDDLNFQVIIYDSNVWITETGDPNILIQYKNVSNTENVRQSEGQVREGVWQYDIPFASVGISSPDGTTGINYTYNNEYPITAAVLEDERALLFATSPRFKAGDLYGQVTDHATGGPVEGVVVFTRHGFTAYTDSTGYWRINGALAEVPFDITAMKQGYNDSTEFDITVEEDDSLEIIFDLLHPEFTPTVWELTAMLDPELETELGFTLTNTGNGPMDWKVERRLLGDANAPPWQYRRSFNVGQAVDDDHMEGVVFVDEHFWVVGGSDSTHMIYKFDRDGALVDTFPQFEHDDRRGMRDLAWDGNLIWGSVDRAIFGFDLEGELVTTFDAPFRPVTAITYDEQLDVLWIAGTTTNITAMTRAGEEIDSLDISRNDLRIYGLGYFRDDPEEAQLYIFHKERETNRQLVYKCNPLVRDTIFVAYLAPEMDASPGGIFITNTYDVYSWVFVALASAGRNAGGDRIDLWQVEARRDWFQLDIVRDENRVEADSGRIETGESFDFILNLNSTELPDTLFEGELLYYHNADSGRGHIYVALDVIGPMEPFPFSLVSPADGDTLDTTAVALAWYPSIDPNDGEEVSYRAWVNLDQDTVDFALDDTTLSVDLLELFGFNIDEPALFNWWVAAYSDPDTVPCETPFSFRYIPPSLLNDPLGGMPVEFGLRSIYPNPFNARVAITFGADVAERTLLRVFDITGRQVAVLYNDVPNVGYRRVVWNADELSSGVYMLHLESAGRVKIAKTILMR